MQQLLVGFMAVKAQSRNRRKSEKGRVYDHFFQVTVFLKENATDDEALGPTIRAFIYGRCESQRLFMNALIVVSHLLGFTCLRTTATMR
jgi:hypothetical protein